MKAFMDRDFLLSTDIAKRLFHDFAKELPRPLSLARLDLEDGKCRVDEINVQERLLSRQFCA